GQFLVACAYSDGKLYYWDPTGADPLVQMAGSPENCKGVVVTPERFVVALGADGDARKIAWADQESLTDWTATAENQAGDFTLTGSGQIMAARRSPSRSEEHTSELQSREKLVCRLLPEKKKLR